MRLASRDLGGGFRQSDFSVPNVHCGGCVHSIEKAVGALSGVEAARVNLSTRRLTVRWRGDGAVPPVVPTLERLGYPANLDDFAAEGGDPALSGLIKALAVAAFSSMNVMMLSGSVWSGADPATRDLLHWICAVLTLPVMLYSSRVFFVSAWQAVRHGRTNMDVPISVGILLAFGLSLYDTMRGGEHAYYDATATLVFFLLIGRTLDHVMRERARTAVRGLARLAARGALVLREDGTRDYLPVNEIEPGLTLLLAVGERGPVDATVAAGRSDLDRSVVNGESAPHAVGPGDMIEAGTLNLTGPLTIVARAHERESFLAEMVRLMEGAESGRAGFRRLADRVAAYYAPVVHIAAFATFVAWMIATGDLHRAIVVAIAVLIITCPCALGLAVPMVQVMAARRLFEHGIMIKDGAALERLETVDTIVFDKTGTLTNGTPRLVNATQLPPDILARAGALAAHSRHPHALAIAAASHGISAPLATDVAEHPGAGIVATLEGAEWRLGRADWALSTPGGVSGTVLACDGELMAQFAFEDTLRPGATAAIAALRRAGYAIEIVSGDNAQAVARVAIQLGVKNWVAGVMPQGKMAHLAALSEAGRHVLMVGDGLNDAPALAAAHASMAPANAADIGRSAADLVFLRDSLTAVSDTLRLTHAAGQLVRQNLILALGYNVIAIPVAVLGYATPFVAAIAMSLSSVVVVANALRLTWPREGNRKPLSLVSSANVERVLS